MKNIFFIIVLLYSYYFSKAQTWRPIGNGMNSGYTGVTAVDTAAGQLYAAGDNICDTSGPMDCSSTVNVWTSIQWNNILPINGFSIYTWSMTAYRDTNYVSNEEYGIVKLNPNNSGFKSISDVYCYALATWGNNLYVAGQFDSISGTRANNIAMWNGSQWSPLGNGVNGTVNSLTVYKGNLYAGGTFDSAGGIHVNNIAVWNGVNWDSVVGKGVNGTISALAAYNGDLYALGNFDSANGKPVRNIASWDGFVWDSVGGGINGSVSSLSVYNGNLYVAGYFDSAGRKPANNIAQWNGTAWDSLGSGTNGEVKALTVYNGGLCVGGLFSLAGGIPVNNIAGWCNGCPLSVNQLSFNNTNVRLFPNPSNGSFTLQLIQTSTNNNVNTLGDNRNYINVFNTYGQLVFQSVTNQNTINIDLSDQTKGLYLIRVQNGSNVFTRKLSLQ
jgi:hypothetical protein